MTFMSQKVSVVNIMWTNEQRAFAVEAYIRGNESVIVAQRAFRIRFRIPRRQAIPDRKSITLWVKNFREAGTVVRKRGGRPRTARTLENIEAVRRSILRSPTRSARKHATALRLSNRTMRRILHQDLNLHSYKMLTVQELSERDWHSRIVACNEMIENLLNDMIVYFSDEAHFHVSGCVNKQNFRYWSENNPRVIHQKPLHSDRVTVWCAVSRIGIIGPYFFEEGNRAVTVNSERYVSMLQNFFAPALEQLGLQNVWFQQDGATAHTARPSMLVLREMFPARLISQRGDIPWPARSPDLSPCDFFLWGYLKAEVYKHRPRNLQTLKEAIRTEIHRIPAEMLVRVMRNFRDRLQQCVDNEGQHLPDVIFKTR